MGGAVKAINSGYMQREIAESAYRYQRSIESHERVVVGVNEFMMEEAPFKDILRVTPEIEKRQIEKLKEVKRERDQRLVIQKLAVVKKCAETSENLVPPILDAARSYATVGEISDTLRAVFGVYQERN